jgi:hypothetical protein
MVQVSVEKVHGTYRDLRGDIFRVSELDPGTTDGIGLSLCASGIVRVVKKSWHAKFVPAVLDEKTLRAKLHSPERQIDAIREAKGKARYFVAIRGTDTLQESGDAWQVVAMARVEGYTPRLPTWRNPGRCPYPNITDLETLDGTTKMETYGVHALALAHAALRDAHPNHKVAAYTESPNPDGELFFQDLGMQRRRVIPGDLGVDEFTYVHMEAATVGPVQEKLAASVKPYEYVANSS